MKYLALRLQSTAWWQVLLTAFAGALMAVWMLLHVAHAEEIDEVVLIVDDIAITQHEYNVLYYVQTQADTFEMVTPELDSVATETIVDEMLLTAHARRLAPDARINEAQLDQTIQTLAGRNQLTPDQLLSSLQSQGIDVEIFKSSLRERLLVQQVIGQRIAGSVNVSPIEVKDYIENRPELRAQAQKTFRVSHLVISLEEGLSRGDKKKRTRAAQNIRARLLAGEDLTVVAEEYEYVSASGKDGDLGWKTPTDLPELFVDALDTLQVGEVSDVLESSNGFHLLVLTDVKSASTAPQEYHIRHIAKALPEGAPGRELEAQLKNIKLQILAGLDFAAIARTQSDDTGSAQGGGDLGWISLNEIDPQFAAAVRNIEVGAISEPVRSTYGLHLIQILQIRDVPGSATLENRVQQRIFSEKLDEKMQDLLNDLKQSALVEVVDS